MLNRLTISALLKSVIALMAACVVVFLIMDAWDSWGRLQAAGRISVIAEASENAFRAMHNLRTDRANTVQTLNGESVIDGATEKTLRDYRDTENSAMKSVADLGATVEFAERKTLLPTLSRLAETLKALQGESSDAMRKLKESRRLPLAKEYAETVTASLATLDKLSTQLAAAVSHNDAVVDQMLAIKQLAWLLQTAKATDDISEQIADIQKVAGEAIEAIQAIGGIIGEVNEVATAIAAAVEEQGAATQEITRSTQQAAQGTKNVSDNIVGVSAGADAAGAAAQNVKTASEMLAVQTQQLRGQVDAFLGRIRAA